MSLEKHIEGIRKALRGGLKGTGPWHRRLSDFESIDEVTIKIIPRYKTSGMSGDEWRQSIFIVAKFKGVTVFERRAGKMEYALAMLYAFKAEAFDNGLPDGVLAQEEKCCDQPSCANKATNVYAMKKIHGDGNSISADAMESSHGRGYYRQFCNRHAQRGDCCLDDTDSNYIPLEGGPEYRDRHDEDVSPSAGPIMIDID